MTSSVVAETFDDRWARWRTAAAEQDRRWRRVAIGAAFALAVAGGIWLAVALVGA